MSNKSINYCTEVVIEKSKEFEKMKKSFPKTESCCLVKHCSGKGDIQVNLRNVASNAENLLGICGDMMSATSEGLKSIGINIKDLDKRIAKEFSKDKSCLGKFEATKTEKPQYFNPKGVNSTDLNKRTVSSFQKKK